MQTQKVTEHIINWLKNYAETAKMNGFVIGISGGIDSAVVSTLTPKERPSAAGAGADFLSEKQLRKCGKFGNRFDRNF